MAMFWVGRAVVRERDRMDRARQEQYDPVQLAYNSRKTLWPLEGKNACKRTFMSGMT